MANNLARQKAAIEEYRNKKVLQDTASGYAPGGPGISQDKLKNLQDLRSQVQPIESSAPTKAYTPGGEYQSSLAPSSRSFMGKKKSFADTVRNPDPNALATTEQQEYYGTPSTGNNTGPGAGEGTGHGADKKKGGDFFGSVGGWIKDNPKMATLAALAVGRLIAGQNAEENPGLKTQILGDYGNAAVGILKGQNDAERNKQTDQLKRDELASEERRARIAADTKTSVAGMKLTPQQTARLGAIKQLSTNYADPTLDWKLTKDLKENGVSDEEMKGMTKDQKTELLIRSKFAEFPDELDAYFGSQGGAPIQVRNTAAAAPAAPKKQFKPGDQKMIDGAMRTRQADGTWI